MRPPSKFFRLSIRLFAAVLLSVVLLHAQSEPDLKGVVRTKSGYPLARASVMLFSDDRVRKSVTNDKGEFEFANLPIQTYELQASFIGYRTGVIPGVQIEDSRPKYLILSLAPWNEEVPETPSEDHCPEISISAVPGTYDPIAYQERHAGPSVAGSVRDLDTRRGPLTDVILRLTKPGDVSREIYKIKSDKRGEFQFADIEPGKYQLHVSLEGFYDGSTMNFWVARENTTRIGLIGMWGLGWQDICNHMTTVTEERKSIAPPSPEVADPWPYPLPRVSAHLLRPLRRWRTSR